jgi:hypothetical protein
MSNAYIDAGFPSRRAYLENLADETGHAPRTVFFFASMLGPSEDFDGLVTTLEDTDPEDCTDI